MWSSGAGPHLRSSPSCPLSSSHSPLSLPFISLLFFPLLYYRCGSPSLGAAFQLINHWHRSCCNDSHRIRSEVKTFSRTSKRDAVLFSHQTFSASIYITWLNPSVTLAQAITMNKMLSGLLCIMFANSEVKDHPSVQCIIRKRRNHHSPRWDNMKPCHWIRYVEI